MSWTVPNGQSGPTSKAYAVNMNSRIEGRADAAAEVKFATERVAGIQGGASVETSAWPWLLLSAVAVLFLEWWVWLRRV